MRTRPAVLNIAWVSQDKNVLLVGGGKVGVTRVEKLLIAKTNVTVISPEVEPLLETLANDGKITWIKRKYAPDHSDLEGQWDMVLTAIPDGELSAAIVIKSRELGILVNAADINQYCDFYFEAQASVGQLRVSVSTGGNSPGLAGRFVRDVGEFARKNKVSEAMDRVGDLRQQLRAKFPGDEHKVDRMRFIKKLCDGRSYEELAALTDTDISYFLKAFKFASLPKKKLRTYMETLNWVLNLKEDEEPARSITDGTDAIPRPEPIADTSFPLQQLADLFPGTPSTVSGGLSQDRNSVSNNNRSSISNNGTQSEGLLDLSAPPTMQASEDAFLDDSTQAVHADTLMQDASEITHISSSSSVKASSISDDSSDSSSDSSSESDSSSGSDSDADSDAGPEVSAKVEEISSESDTSSSSSSDSDSEAQSSPRKKHKPASQSPSKKSETTTPEKTPDVEAEGLAEDVEMDESDTPEEGVVFVAQHPVDSPAKRSYRTSRTLEPDKRFKRSSVGVFPGKKVPEVPSFPLPPWPKKPTN